VDRARELLGTFGDLRCLLDAAPGDACAARGLGAATYVQLQAALELSRRYLFARLSRGRVLGSPEEVRQFLQLKLRRLEHEVFACLFLDNQHAVIGYEELFRGTIDGASVYPREVVKRCLALNAAAVIFAHNHPSGVARALAGRPAPHPAAEGRARYGGHKGARSLRVGDAEALSFAERGLL
jgi:DNA repair protein RadC